MLIYLKKLTNPIVWKKQFFTRFTEPLHLNVLSVFVALFGSFRSKVIFDLILRPQHAFAILEAADQAKKLGRRGVTLIEFGVANGEGLLNICHIAKQVQKVTGIEFRIFGFDTGQGMPPPESYKDHPDLYQEGDYAMDVELLKSRLPQHAKLLIGDIQHTIPEFLKDLSPEFPIGFISVDVDYYSSTKQAMKCFVAQPELYLPRVHLYFDDLEDPVHNSYCGELLAIREFNEHEAFRKIEKHAFFKVNRIFKNARWIDHMYTLHVLDHPTRATLVQSRKKEVIKNYYL